MCSIVQVRTSQIATTAQSATPNPSVLGWRKQSQRSTSFRATGASTFSRHDVKLISFSIKIKSSWLDLENAFFQARWL
jgi:hypothetical protein